jgi:hypothetical protein
MSDTACGRRVSQAEGFDKDELFGILDTLLKGTDSLLLKARAQLKADKGASSLDPWNTSFMMAGSIEKEMDPCVPLSFCRSGPPPYYRLLCWVRRKPTRACSSVLLSVTIYTACASVCTFPI